MDDIDQQLLQFLREDARMSVLMLAKKLRLSRTTVQKRLTKLESAGVIGTQVTCNDEYRHRR